MKMVAGLALLALVLAAPAQAQTDEPKQRVEVDTNVICDTQQQVERFLALFDSSQGSVETALDGVNAEQSSPEACVIATTVHQRAGQVATVQNADATFDVMRIVVVGVYTVHGLEGSLPTEFYTLVARDDEAATVGQRP